MHERLLKHCSPDLRESKARVVLNLTQTTDKVWVILMQCKALQAQWRLAKLTIRTNDTHAPPLQPPGEPEQPGTSSPAQSSCRWLAAQSLCCRMLPQDSHGPLPGLGSTSQLGIEA